MQTFNKETTLATFGVIEVHCLKVFQTNDVF